MTHDNVVELFDYTETKNEYVLYMEYCDKADYLTQKIHEVSFNLDSNLINRVTLVLKAMINWYHMQQISSKV
jgi:hypothetical protein